MIEYKCDRCGKLFQHKNDYKKAYQSEESMFNPKNFPGKL